MINGLDAKRNDPAEWSWAFGVGEEGWKKLKAFVENGGTLLAIGNGGRDRARPARLADRESVAGSAAAIRRTAASAAAISRPPRHDVDAALKDAFSSPTRLMQTLRDRVADPDSLFYCPGSLLQERVRLEQSGGVGHAGGVAGVLRGRPGIPPASGLRHRDAGGVALPAAERPRERMAAGRGIPEGPGQHPLVQDRQRAPSSPTAARSTSAPSRARRGS